MKLQASDLGITIHLDRTLNFDCLSDYINQLKQVIELKQPIVIEAEDLSQIDSAGLQLLLAFLNEVKRQNISFQWLKPSAALLHMAVLLGMDKLLGLINSA